VSKELVSATQTRRPSAESGKFAVDSEKTSFLFVGGARAARHLFRQWHHQTPKTKTTKVNKEPEQQVQSQNWSFSSNFPDFPTSDCFCPAAGSASLQTTKCRESKLSMLFLLLLLLLDRTQFNIVFSLICSTACNIYKVPKCCSNSALPRVSKIARKESVLERKLAAQD